MLSIASINRCFPYGDWLGALLTSSWGNQSGVLAKEARIPMAAGFVGGFVRFDVIEATEPIWQISTRDRTALRSVAPA